MILARCPSARCRRLMSSEAFALVPTDTVMSAVRTAPNSSLASLSSAGTVMPGRFGDSRLDSGNWLFRVQAPVPMTSWLAWTEGLLV